MPQGDCRLQGGNRSCRQAIGVATHDSRQRVRSTRCRRQRVAKGSKPHASYWLLVAGSCLLLFFFEVFILEDVWGGADHAEADFVFTGFAIREMFCR